MSAGPLVFVVTAAIAAFVASAPVAEAIPNTCPTSGPDAGTVNINQPPPGSSFAGQVTVRGRASAVAGLSRVELFVGEALKDFQIFEPPRTDVEFLLRFEVASVRTTTATLSVVACGGAPGAAVRGIASIDVLVDRAAVVTAPPMAITPVEGGDRADSGIGTGPAWVGAAFGMAGLVGLVAAARVRGARGARTSPSVARLPGVGQTPGPRDRPGGDRAARPGPTADRPQDAAATGIVAALRARPPAEPEPEVAAPRAASEVRKAGRPRRGGGDDGWPARRR